MLRISFEIFFNFFFLCGDKLCGDAPVDSKMKTINLRWGATCPL